MRPHVELDTDFITELSLLLCVGVVDTVIENIGGTPGLASIATVLVLVVIIIALVITIIVIKIKRNKVSTCVNKEL